MITKLDSKVAPSDKKEFIFDLVVLPNKFTFELYELNLLTIEFRNNFWAPILGE
jgi:hypothetical protein